MKVIQIWRLRDHHPLPGPGPCGIPSRPSGRASYLHFSFQGASVGLVHMYVSSSKSVKIAVRQIRMLIWMHRGKV